jgi:hypothetical protein
VRRRQEKGAIMADRLPLSALSDAELEQMLTDLSPHLFPSTPDLATQVRQRLESEAASTLTATPEATLTPTAAQRAPGPVRWERDYWRLHGASSRALR